MGEYLIDSARILTDDEAGGHGGRWGRAGNTVGRGHERVGTVVDVEQRALRALELQVLAFAVRFVQCARHVGHQGREARR